MKAGKPRSGAFNNAKDGGISTAWNRYATAEKTKERARQLLRKSSAEGFAVVALLAGDVRTAKNQIMRHTPRRDHRAHTDVFGGGQNEIRNGVRADAAGIGPSFACSRLHALRDLRPRSRRRVPPGPYRADTAVLLGTHEPPASLRLLGAERLRAAGARTARSRFGRVASALDAGVCCSHDWREPARRRLGVRARRRRRAPGGGSRRDGPASGTGAQARGPGEQG